MKELDKSYWYNTMCYAGYNLRPYKVSDGIYQLKCYSAKFWTKFDLQLTYLQFDLDYLKIDEYYFLKLFDKPDNIINFVVSKYFVSKDNDGIKYVETFENPREFKPWKYDYKEHAKLRNKLQKVKPQTTSYVKRH